MTAVLHTDSPRDTEPSSRIARVELPDAVTERLYFAQVREDARIELDALRPTPSDRIVIVSSGGCTALALLAAGAGRVEAVDRNRTQNHLVELKRAACVTLGGDDATAMLGGTACGSAWRVASYESVRGALSPMARAYWDGRPHAIASGVLESGVSERFIRLVVGAMRMLVHSDARIERLLACRTLAEQRALFSREWNSRRWRLLIGVLLNRRAFDRAFDPRFFAGATSESFAERFLARMQHGLTELPVQTNYFLHQMLTRHYGDERPAYLERSPGGRLSDASGTLTLVDGSMTAWLARQEAGSIDGFALSNICEWLSRSEVDALFGEIVRTAACGARLVFRNFVGWTEVPERWRTRVVEDRARGDALIANDRSLVQARVAVCSVRGA